MNKFRKTKNAFSINVNYQNFDNKFEIGILFGRKAKIKTSTS